MIDRSRAVLASIERRHSARVDLPFERGDDLDDGGDEPEPHETVDRELVRPGNVRPPRRVQVEPDVGPGGKDLADALLLRLDPGVRVVVVVRGGGGGGGGGQPGERLWLRRRGGGGRRQGRGGRAAGGCAPPGPLPLLSLLPLPELSKELALGAEGPQDGPVAGPNAVGRAPEDVPEKVLGTAKRVAAPLRNSPIART